MPTIAFNNLSEDKKKKILDAARIEFSNNLFENASINKIVKSIDMPRGTFYLYFENKEDIYSYLFENYRISLDKIIMDTLIKNKGNIFDTYIDLFDLLVSNTSSEMKNLINNFFINMNSNRIEKSVSKKDNHEVIEHINLDILNISQEEVYILLSVLMPLFFQNVACAFIHKDCVKEIKQHYVKQINIIRKGIERI